MWKRGKKFILIAVLVVVVLAGSLAGMSIANAATSDNTTPQQTLSSRVAQILGIDQQRLDDAFKQARQEQQQQALDNYLKKLVDAGKITQAQADQYEQWWQSRPDVPLPGLKQQLERRGFRMGPRPGFRCLPNGGQWQLPALPPSPQQ